jgi:peptide/nickel transport system substrate-binding protein/oligopeptide transport system substrate-binding protein
VKTPPRSAARRPVRAALFALAALVPSAILLSACSSRTPEVAKPEQVFRVRMRENPPDIDPARSGDTLSDRVNLEVHDGLVDFEPDTLAVIPALAESWEISADGGVYTFRLRGGARFHNGRAVRAEDVVYSFTRILDPGVNSKRRELFAAVRGAEPFSNGTAGRVEGLEAPDDRTVRITLERPLPHFLQLLANPAAAVVPKEVYADPAKPYLDHPVGCGPFRVVRWERSNFLELAAFDEYYRGRPRLDRVLFRFIENPATAMEEYRSGGLEVMDEFPGSVADLERDLPGEVRRGPYLATYYYGMNLARKPFAGNPDLRKAFNYAVDRKGIAEQIFEGGHTPAAGILPPGIPGRDASLTGYTRDLDKAREHLARAGYPGGRGLPVIDLWVNSHQKHLAVAQKVQADLAEAGIRVRIKAVDFAALLQAAEGRGGQPGEALLWRYGWQAEYPDPDAFLYPLLHTRNFGASGNLSRYSNPRVDELLDRARGLTRMEERIPLYREAERIAVEEDAVWLFLTDYTQRILIKPYVKGVVLSPLGTNRIPFDRLWLDPPPPARGAASR